MMSRDPLIPLGPAPTPGQEKRTGYQPPAEAPTPPAEPELPDTDAS